MWTYVLLALLVVECAPVWVFRYFPSQDGPSHLHNASVLAHHNIPIYRQYYEVDLLNPAGNLLSHVLLAGLISVSGPEVAEKLFLTLYFVLFFFSFRYFLRAFSPHAESLSCLAAILAPNWFLYMGFYNFAFSVCFVLLIVGYGIRRGANWNAPSLAVLAAGGMITYVTHALSWAVCLMSVTALSITRLMTRDRRPFEYVKPILCLLPPGLLASIYLAESATGAGCAVEQSLFDRLRTLYTLPFLYTVADTDRLIARVVAICLAVIVGFAVAVAWRERKCLRDTLSFLLAGGGFVAIILVGPDGVGGGCLIHRRLSLYAWIFLVAAVAAAARSSLRRPLKIASVLFCCVAVVALALRSRVVSSWNDRLAAVSAIGQNMRPNSTALILNLDVTPGAVKPYDHALGLLTSRAIVDLGNYEAFTDHFPTRFRPEVMPSPLLATIHDLAAVPPVFHAVRYETRTKGRLDYILFQGREDAPESALYPAQMRLYRLVATGDRGRLRLYERATAKQ